MAGIAFALLWWLTPTEVTAGDWPQILGPHRNGEAEHESIADKWPADGPTTLWTKPIGSGFSGVAVSGKTVVLFHRIESTDHEELVAFKTENGNKLWDHSAPTSYSGSIVEDNGPRCVPLIYDEKVIAFGAQGMLWCQDLNKGNTIWSRNTHADYRAPAGYFGAGSSPIVVEDKVIVNVGGARAGAGIVAFALKDGEEVWKSTNELASYSSPVLAKVGDVDHLICVTRLKGLSLDPATGKVRFEFPYGNRGPTVNAANPIVLGENLFLTASYGIGAVYGKIGKDAFENLWSSDEVLSSQYTTCIHDDGLLYGVHGRQDAGVASLRCIDPKSKEIRWEHRDFGYATLIKADGKILALKSDGELVLFKIDGMKFNELARVKLFSNETRSLPALSNGRLFVRDTQTLKCVDLGAKN